MKLSKLGLLLLCPLTLGGCSGKVLTRTETVLLAPPDVLLTDYQETAVAESGTNEDLLAVALALKADLAECNRKVARTREWVAKEKTAMGKGH